MAFVCEVVHFDTAATVNLPLTKFSASEMPKMVIFLTMNKLSTFGTGLDPTMCLGFETSAGNRFTAAQAYLDNQTNQAYASGHVDSTSYGMQWGYLSSTSGQTIVARATVTAWASTGLTVTFSLVPGTPVKCAALVLGGSHFTAGVPSVITQNGSTGSRSVTGLGFNPNGLFVINGTVAATGQTAHSWIGVVDSDGNQMCTWGLSNGFGNGVRRKQRLDAIGVQSWAGSEYSRQAFTAWQSGGYTYNDQLSYNTARYIHIPFRIDPAAGRCELDVQSWASTSLQTQTVSSGHTPIGLFGLGYCGASSASDLTTACALGVGFTDFTTHACGTLYVSGTYPSVSRCGLHFDNDSYYAGFSAYNVEAHQLVPSSRASGQYVIYPALQAGQQVGTLAFLSRPSGGERKTQGYPFIRGKYPMLTKLPVHGDWIALGYQQLASLSSASSLTVPAGSTIALVQAETQNVRWRDDGTNPTSSVGMIIEAGYSHVFSGALSALKFIETTASAKLNVSYYK